MTVARSFLTLLLAFTFIVVGCQNDNGKRKTRIAEGTRNKITYGDLKVDGSESTSSPDHIPTKGLPEIDFQSSDKQICNISFTNLCHSVYALVLSDGAVAGLDRQNLVNQNNGYKIADSEIQKDSTDSELLFFAKRWPAAPKGNRARLVMIFTSLTDNAKEQLQQVNVEGAQVQTVEFDKDDMTQLMYELQGATADDNVTVALSKSLNDSLVGQLTQMNVKAVVFEDIKVDVVGVENYLLKELGHVVYLSYILPQKFEAVDELSVEVHIGDNKLTEDDISFDKDTDDRFRVNIVNRDKIASYSDEVRITYRLK